MGKKLTKKQRQQLRKKRNEKKIKKMEKEDSKGISRKKIKNAMRPELFLSLKVISIVSILLLYIIYSPLLIIGILFTVSIMFFAHKAENYINHSYIKSNHIKIPKIDSVIAIIVIIITIASACLSAGNSPKHSQDSVLMDIKMTFENIGSCLTGRRSIIPHHHAMNFGSADIPTDLPSQGGERGPMNMEDLPLEAVFSMMLSSVNSVLIFLVPVTGLITLIAYFIKRHKFDEKMNELITDTYKELSDDDYERIFSFGILRDENGNKILLNDIDDSENKDIKL